MPQQPPCPFDSPHPEPSPAEPVILRDILAQAARDPWLASLQARQLTTLRERLGELRAWLASLPRRMRRAWVRRWAMALPAAALLLALSGGGATARMDATIVVDAPGGVGVVVIAADGDCSLREAIVNANNNAATHADCTAGSGPDTIQLPAGSTFTVPDVHSTTYGQNGLPSITTEITIEGNGSTIERAPADPDTFRLFHVAVSGDLTLDATTVTGGVADDITFGSFGGGIYNQGALALLNNSTVSGNSAHYDGGGINGAGSATLTNSTISGNTASSFGGGISLSGSGATLINSTVSGNSAGGYGGGIMSLIGSSVTLTGSTISGNSAGLDGGGIYANTNTVSLTNSTVSGNTADRNGGGISIAVSTVNLTHATISGNSAGSSGGGIFAPTASLIDSRSSIVAGQTAGADCALLGTSTLTSNGYNVESATSCGFAGTGDQQNVTNAQLNLDPLALNTPGNTQTHALGPGSFALNQIPSGTNGCGTTITTDQRGVTRPQPAGGSCDVGAYEFQAAAAPTAAQVTQFAAAPDATGRIRVTWETASEVDVTGFRVERAGAADGPWRAVGGLVPARGSAAGGATYAVTDAPGVGRFAYRLEVVGGREGPQTFGPREAVVRTLRAFLPLAWR